MIQQINIPPVIDFNQGIGLIAEIGKAVADITENVKPSSNRDEWRKDKHASKNMISLAKAKKKALDVEIEMAKDKLKAVVEILSKNGLSDEDKLIINKLETKIAMQIAQI